ncbi:hypothetical protein [Methylococcus sp. Mc7]|uniref:hypothetical protein n=1 Tax=Methylococcus sp. Mc7 TaxID=2860258 RepID=UPI001C530A57|nr:hypothetical protein [Methylococcus sp. Mc7]QXP86236.1 hypothetical protein KW115_12975 [Methylococcus sp. Mc7]
MTDTQDVTDLYITGWARGSAKSRHRDDDLNRVSAPEGGLLSFARPKESNQRKGRPTAAKAPERQAFCRGAIEGAFFPSIAKAASLRLPFGPFPAKALALGRGIRDSPPLERRLLNLCQGRYTSRLEKEEEAGAAYIDPESCFVSFNPVIRLSVLMRYSNHEEMVLFDRI